MAIVATLPGALGKRLEELRRKLDPEGSGALPPHIPIVAPFEVEPSFLPLEQHIWNVCHDTPPFEVELGGLALDGEASLPLERGNERFAALREALLTGKYAPRRTDEAYAPRAVVGRVAERDEAVLAQREGARGGGAFLLERVELMARYPDGTWYERDFYTLDKALS